MKILRASRVRNAAAKKSLSLRLVGGLTLLALVLAHLMIGTDPAVLAVALATMAVSLLPLWILGPLNLGALLVAVTSIRYVGVVLLAKLFMGQPLQSNLMQPLPSFLVVLVGMLGYALAALLASRLTVRKAWLPRIQEPSAIRRLAITAALIGFSALAVAGKGVNDAAQGQGTAAATAGAGGAVNFLGNFMMMALIAAFAGALMKSAGRKSLDVLATSITAAIVVLALIFNTRSILVATLIAYVVSIFAYRGAVRPGLLFVLGAGLAAMMLVITPLTLYVRAQVYDATVSQRVETVIEALQNWDKVMSAYDEFVAPDPQNDRFYLSYYGTRQNTLERVSQINHVDIIKNAVDQQGALGWDDTQEALARALPSFLGFEKHTEYSTGDYFFCKLHVNCFYGGRATVPLIAAGYGSFGWYGAFLYPFVLTTPLLLLFNLVAGPSLKSNLWAIFFFIESYWGFSEGGSDYYVVETVRYLPQYMAVFGVINIALGIGKIKLFRTSAGQHLIRTRLAAPRPSSEP